MAFITMYRIEHPRMTAAWVAEWQMFAGEQSESWWTEYDDYDEAMEVADKCDGIVVEFKRHSNLRDAYARTLGPVPIAAE